MAEALYRKYRPQIFEDVVGQEHIERTIKNAIEQDKVSHAYLFTGPRGTGKTTTARLLAKALLCETGPTPEPDGSCDNCLSIAAGTHSDVYELDAASRTGVENVREEIIGRVQFAPTQGRYKVYIIDEVHMLSTAAFNALLKTLEEPPDHVVFVLCTTDPQKVPETIHSRCQRFDFRRISNEEIVSRLGAICVAEGVEFEGEALDLIALRAEGGMRNALTSLEQVIAFSEGKVSLEAAERLLGSLDSNDLAEIVSAIGKRDVATCFSWTSNYVETGADLAQFVRDLAEHMRNMFVLSLSDSDAVLEVNEALRRELLVEMDYFSPDRLTRMLSILGDLSAELRTSSNQRLSFEIALTRMVRPDSDLSLESLAERIEVLEAAYSSGHQSKAPVASPMQAVREPENQRSRDEDSYEEPHAYSDFDLPQDEVEHTGVVSTDSPVVSQEATSTISGSSTSGEMGSVDFSNPAALQRMWQAAMQTVKKDKAAYGVLFLNTKIHFDAQKQELDIEFPAENVFAYSAVQKPEVITTLTKALTEAAGRVLAFHFSQANNESTPPSVQTRSTPVEVPQQEQEEEEVAPPSEEPVVKQLDEDELKSMLTKDYGEGVVVDLVEDEASEA